MPYARNAELPASIRNHLPDHAQDIFRSAFNSAYESHADDPSREEISYRIAWAAVKRRYGKVGSTWVERSK